jgi:hypothetical protein
LGRKTLLTFLSFRRQFLMSFSQFLETVYNELSPILETVSDQFSSIFRIVSDEFSSFFGDRFCSISFPTFRKISTSSNAFNESIEIPSVNSCRERGRLRRRKNWVTVLA